MDREGLIETIKSLRERTKTLMMSLRPLNGSARHLESEIAEFTASRALLPEGFDRQRSEIASIFREKEKFRKSSKQVSEAYLVDANGCFGKQTHQ
jgi:hypothetical protein